LRLDAVILLLFVCLFGSYKISAQTYNYTYTDPCTGNDKTIIVPINGNVTVGYYGSVGSFSYNDFTNGVFESWASNIFTQYGTNSPCSEIVGLGTAINVTQSTALNVIGILNSLSTISDIAGSTNILGGSVSSVSNAGNGGGSGKKESKKNNNSGSSGNSESQGNTSGSQQGSAQNNTTSTTTSGEGSQNTGNTTNTPAGTTTGGSGSQQGSAQNNTAGTATGGEGSQNTGNTTTTSGGNTQSGQTNTTGEGTTTQTQGTTTTQGEQQNSNTTAQGSENGQTNNQTSGNGESGNNNSNGNTGNTGNSGSGTGNGSSNGQNQEGQTQTTTEESGKTNITGGATTTVKSTPTSKEGGKPTVVGSADFIGFNFKNSEVRTGAKATGGYTSMRWDGKRSYGALVDYTSALKGPNITTFYAWIRPKSIILTSGTLTVGFEGNRSLYGTFAAGQMFNIKKPKNLKLLYMATVSYGTVYRESFLGTALIVGGTYDFKVGKRFDIKLMNLMVYAPYVSYYNDVLLKSPYVMLPSIGTNIKITKKFKFNINGGGAWDLKTSALNYTITCGTRFVIGQ
jgi:hypothetical protein